MRRDISGLPIGGSEALRLAVTKMLLDIIFEAAVISAFSPTIGGDGVRGEKRRMKGEPDLCADAVVVPSKFV